MQLPFEKFQALNVLAMCRHIFTRRIPGVHVSHDKAEALKRLESAHRFKGDRTNARKILDRAPGSYRPAQPVHSSAPLRGRFRCGYHSTMSDCRLERDS